jgi:hypothetical protein
MQWLNKLFASSREDARRMTAITSFLMAEKLARLSRYKGEIMTWEAKRERILGDLKQRQQALRENISQLQEIEDLVKKRYMMKSLLQQWRTTCLTIGYQQWKMNTRIMTLTSQFTYELSVLAAYTPWRKHADKAVLMHDSVLVVIEELIGIYERLDDTRAKPDLARNIKELIDAAAALDARSVRSHAQIVHFRKESAYRRSSLPRRIMTRHSLRQLSIARHQ